MPVWITSRICVPLLWIKLYTSAYSHQLPSVGEDLIHADSIVCWANANKCKCRCLPGRASSIVCSEKHRSPTHPLPLSQKPMKQTQRVLVYHLKRKHCRSDDTVCCARMEGVHADRELMWLLEDVGWSKL